MNEEIINLIRTDEDVQKFYIQAYEQTKDVRSAIDMTARAIADANERVASDSTAFEQSRPAREMRDYDVARDAVLSTDVLPLRNERDSVWKSILSGDVSGMSRFEDLDKAMPTIESKAKGKIDSLMNARDKEEYQRPSWGQLLK